MLNIVLGKIGIADVFISILVIIPCLASGSAVIACSFYPHIKRKLGINIDILHKGDSAAISDTESVPADCMYQEGKRYFVIQHLCWFAPDLARYEVRKIYEYEVSNYEQRC